MVRTVTGAPDRPDAAACNHTCPACNRMSPACNRTRQALLIDMTPPPGKDGVQGRRQFVQFIFDAQAGREQVWHLEVRWIICQGHTISLYLPYISFISPLSRCAGSSARATASRSSSSTACAAPSRHGARPHARTPARPHARTPALTRSLTHSLNSFFHLEPLLHLPTLLTSLLRHSHAC